VILAVCEMLCLAAAPPARAQSISTADLAGTWSVFQLATPSSGPFTGASVRTYRGTLTFDDTGTVTAGTLTDNQQPTPSTFDVTGNLTITPGGVIVNDTLALDDHLGGGGDLDIREARLLVAKHTIVGAATILTSPGLFTFVRLEAAPFLLNADLAGDWTYHEITPSNQVPLGLSQGDATWARGSITFHDDNGCTEADLTLADGTARAQRDSNPQSFG